ncbi:MAG: hypothetical protein DRN71_01055 [Candidatus Nanohalarchaeota archaeon]|nr:MAG: hypothetical protein DRN71_01055 [Candidatus Nanohaloarchaeota archaeon]
MDRTTLIIFTILISVSGCLQQISTNFDQNAGAVVQDTSFDTPEVYDDEIVSLMFDVVNVGGKEISGTDGIKVYVYGPKIENKSGSENVWRLERSDSAAVSENGYITTSISSVDLPPPHPSLGASGGRRSFEFEFDPADVLDGIEIPVIFYVSLCYPYTTKTITQIEVTSRNELRATGVRSSRKDTINAAGPVHLSVQGEGNIRAGGIIPLVFKVTDVGGGFATLDDVDCAADQPTSVRNRVKINVTVDGDKNVDCSSTDNIVRLKNGVGTLFCKYNLPDTSGAPRRTYMVRATVTYKYYTTSTTTVTNIGSSLLEAT